MANISLVSAHELARKLLEGPDWPVVSDGYFVKGEVTSHSVPDVNAVPAEAFQRYKDDDDGLYQEEWAALIVTMPKINVIDIR